MKTVLSPVTTKKDIKKVALLADVIWRQHYIPIIGQEQVEYMLEEIQSVSAISKSIEREEFSYYLINTPEEEVGYLGLVPDHKGGLFLSKLYLLESARGQGLARTAVEFSVAHAKEKGFSPLWLTCNVKNTDTLKAYKAMGFVQVGTQQGDIGAGYIMDDCILEKEI